MAALKSTFLRLGNCLETDVHQSVPSMAQPSLKADVHASAALRLELGVERLLKRNLYDCFGRSTEVRADFTSGSLLSYTGRPVTHFPHSASDGRWPTRAGRNRFTLDVVSSADSPRRWIPSIRSVALSGHDAAPNFTLQEFGIRLS